MTKVTYVCDYPDDETPALKAGQYINAGILTKFCSFDALDRLEKLELQIEDLEGRVTADNTGLTPSELTYAKLSTASLILEKNFSKAIHHAGDASLLVDTINAVYESLLGQRDNEDERQAGRAAMLTVSNIVEALNLPDDKSVSAAVIELAGGSVWDELYELCAAFGFSHGTVLTDWLRNQLEELHSRRQKSQPDAVKGCDFSEALMWLKEGKRVQRAGWNGAGQWVRVNNAPERLHGWEDDPRLYCVEAGFLLKNAQKTLVQWLPSIGDLMATDWVVVEND